MTGEDSKKLESLSWSAYEIYCRCPQWFSWSHLPPIREITNPPRKDTQHLVRGNATQAIVTEWVKSGIWATPDHDRQVSNFIRSHIRDKVVEEWIEKPTTREKPGATTWELVEQIQENLFDVLPLFRRHLITQFGDLDGVVLLPQAEFTAKWPHGPLNLTCIADLLAARPGDKAIIYEGKATRKPKFRTADQVRWQVELYDAVRRQEQDQIPPPPAEKHFYVFYETANIRAIHTHTLRERESEPSGEQKDWLVIRDTLIQRIVDGDMKATPERFGCYICPHQYSCPDLYKPKRRKIEPATIPSKRGRKINAL